MSFNCFNTFFCNLVEVRCNYTHYLEEQRCFTHHYYFHFTLILQSLCKYICCNTILIFINHIRIIWIEFKIDLDDYLQIVVYTNIFQFFLFIAIKSVLRARSGNPGYLQGLPVLFGKQSSALSTVNEIIGKMQEQQKLVYDRLLQWIDMRVSEEVS